MSYDYIFNVGVNAKDIAQQIINEYNTAQARITKDQIVIKYTGDQKSMQDILKQIHDTKPNVTISFESDKKSLEKLLSGVDKSVSDQVKIDPQRSGLKSAFDDLKAYAEKDFKKLNLSSYFADLASGFADSSMSASELYQKIYDVKDALDGLKDYKNKYNLEFFNPEQLNKLVEQIATLNDAKKALESGKAEAKRSAESDRFHLPKDKIDRNSLTKTVAGQTTNLKPLYLKELGLEEQWGNMERETKNLVERYMRAYNLFMTLRQDYNDDLAKKGGLQGITETRDIELALQRARQIKELYSELIPMEKKVATIEGAKTFGVGDFDPNIITTNVGNTVDRYVEIFTKSLRSELLKAERTIGTFFTNETSKSATRALGAAEGNAEQAEKDVGRAREKYGTSKNGGTGGGASGGVAGASQEFSDATGEAQRFGEAGVNAGQAVVDGANAASEAVQKLQQEISEAETKLQQLQNGMSLTDAFKGANQDSSIAYIVSELEKINEEYKQIDKNIEPEKLLRFGSLYNILSERGLNSKIPMELQNLYSDLLDKFDPEGLGEFTFPRIQKIVNESAIQDQISLINKLKQDLQNLTTGGPGGGSAAGGTNIPVTPDASHFIEDLQNAIQGKDVKVDVTPNTENFVGDIQNAIKDKQVKVDVQADISNVKRGKEFETKNVGDLLSYWSSNPIDTERGAFINSKTGYSSISVTGTNSRLLQYSDLQKAMDYANSANQMVDTIIHTHPEVQFASLSDSDITTAIDHIKDGITHIIAVAGDEIANLDVSALVNDNINIKNLLASVKTNVGKYANQDAAIIPYQTVVNEFNDNLGQVLQKQLYQNLQDYDIPIDDKLSGLLNEFVQNSVKSIIDSANNNLNTTQNGLINDEISNWINSIVQSIGLTGKEEIADFKISIQQAFDDILFSERIQPIIDQKSAAIHADTNLMAKYQQQALIDALTSLKGDPSKYFQVQSVQNYLNQFDQKNQISVKAKPDSSEYISTLQNEVKDSKVDVKAMPDGKDFVSTLQGQINGKSVEVKATPNTTGFVDKIKQDTSSAQVEIKVSPVSAPTPEKTKEESREVTRPMANGGEVRTVTRESTTQGGSSDVVGTPSTEGVDRVDAAVNRTRSDVERLNEELGKVGNTSISPSQQFDNIIHQNVVMLENYKNTIAEIDRLKLQPQTDETRAKLEELNTLADYFASKITAIRSENGDEINRSMMKSGISWNTNLMSNYTQEQREGFWKVAGERSGIKTNMPVPEFSHISEELNSIELKSNSLLGSLKSDVTESRNYVNQLQRDLIDLIDTKEELAHEPTNSKWFKPLQDDVEKISARSPEILQFLDSLKSTNQAIDFTNSEKWIDFLATLPKAHTYLESIGYDFERIKSNSEQSPISSGTTALPEQEQAAGQAGQQMGESIAEGANKASDAVSNLITVFRGISGKPFFDETNGSAWFSDVIETANTYTKGVGDLYEAKIELGNAMRVDARGADHDQIIYADTKEELQTALDLKRQLDDARSSFAEKYKAYFDGGAKDVSLVGDPKEYLSASDNIDMLESKLQKYLYTTEQLQEIAKSKGFDSLVIDNVLDSFGSGIFSSDKIGTSIAIFNQELIKTKQLIDDINTYKQSNETPVSTQEFANADQSAESHERAAQAAQHHAEAAAQASQAESQQPVQPDSSATERQAEANELEAETAQKAAEAERAKADAVSGATQSGSATPVDTAYVVAQAQGQVESAAAGESSAIEGLVQRIQAITRAVEEKTEAFRTEGQTVDGIVQQEITMLDALLGEVNMIITDLQALATAISTLPEIDLKMKATGDSSPINSQLADVLENLKKSISGFGIDSISSVSNLINSFKFAESDISNINNLSNALDALIKKLQELSSVDSTKGGIPFIDNLLSKSEELKNLASILSESQEKTAKKNVEYNNAKMEERAKQIEEKAMELQSQRANENTLVSIQRMYDSHDNLVQAIVTTQEKILDEYGRLESIQTTATNIHFNPRKLDDNVLYMSDKTTDDYKTGEKEYNKYLSNAIKTYEQLSQKKIKTPELFTASDATNLQQALSVINEVNQKKAQGLELTKEETDALQKYTAAYQNVQKTQEQKNAENINQRYKDDVQAAKEFADAYAEVRNLEAQAFNKGNSNPLSEEQYADALNRLTEAALKSKTALAELEDMANRDLLSKQQLSGLDSLNGQLDRKMANADYSRDVAENEYNKRQYNNYIQQYKTLRAKQINGEQLTPTQTSDLEMAENILNDIVQKQEQGVQLSQVQLEAYTKYKAVLEEISQLEQKAADKKQKDDTAQKYKDLIAVIKNYEKLSSDMNAMEARKISGQAVDHDYEIDLTNREAEAYKEAAKALSELNNMKASGNITAKQLTDAESLFTRAGEGSESSQRQVANARATQQQKLINSYTEAIDNYEKQAKKVAELQERQFFGENVDSKLSNAISLLNQYKEAADNALKSLEQLHQENANLISTDQIAGAKQTVKQADNVKDAVFTQPKIEFTTTQEGYAKLIQYAQKYVEIRDKPPSERTFNEQMFFQNVSKLYDEAINKAGQFADAQETARAGLEKTLANSQQRILQDNAADINKELNKLSNMQWTEQGRTALKGLNEQYVELAKAIRDASTAQDRLNAKDKFEKLAKAVSDFKDKKSTYTPATDLAKDKVGGKMTAWMNQNTAAQQFFPQIEQLQNILKGDIGQEKLKEVADQFERIKAKAAEAGKLGLSFGDSLKKSFSGLARYMMTYVSIYRIIGAIKKAINTVKEFDTALMEVRKVSTETLSSLQAWQKTTFDMANSVGGSALQLQKSTAAWLRLGKDFEEAQRAAQASIKLLNVSEFTNIDDATKSLISISQAYKDLTYDDVIDKLNNVGDHFSSSTDQLAQGLQNAAAVLKTQGNDIDQALALLTAGNNITQDISKTSAGITYARTYENMG